MSETDCSLISLCSFFGVLFCSFCFGVEFRVSELHERETDWCQIYCTFFLPAGKPCGSAGCGCGATTDTGLADPAAAAVP